MERTDQPDQPPTPAQQPSITTLAARILTAAAGILHQDAITPITVWNLEDALTAADTQVLVGITGPDRDTAREQSRSSLPPVIGATCAQYAEQLRAKARDMASATSYAPLGDLVSGDAIHTNPAAATVRTWMTVGVAEHVAATADIRAARPAVTA
ncbi:hypothetical protein [Streptomyces hirsutus]|uniref:hypothetical protein n=1 Tax=Streptomyces hirsutus TaxID=35620 RepID=UPI00369790EA